MTTQQKLIKKKLSLLDLGEFLKNISQACRIIGCSRQLFYDIKKTYEEHDIEAYKRKTVENHALKTAFPLRLKKLFYKWPMNTQLWTGAGIE